MKGSAAVGLDARGPGNREDWFQSGGLFVMTTPRRIGSTPVVRCGLGLGLVLGASALSMVGCGSLNPAFVDLLGGEMAASMTSLDNAAGHVVIAFVNNAEVDERLVDYLKSADGGGLTLTPAEERALRPRVRFRVEVTYTNGSQLTFEFVDGSSNLIDPGYSAQAFPDLNQNDLNNIVVACDVARVEISQTSAVEVFVPSEIGVYELVEVAGAAGGTLRTEFELRETIAPQFSALQQDDTDEDGNVTLRRNIGVRDMPAPVEPLCGSVVAFVLDGVLSVPFLTGVGEAEGPSYDREDQNTEAAIGGRYEFVVSVQ
ncbi:MAG: hypothetical protein KJ749_12145 [Planctomycetes bacterium]|nr:hypothetical protein [Planctomycetota bacterium]